MRNPVSPLHPPCHPQQTAGNDSTPEPLIDVSPHDNIHHAGFVFERKKDHPFGRSGALSQND